MHNDPMEDLVIMYNWYDRNDMMMSLVLSEDALAPELRNPRGSAGCRACCAGSNKAPYNRIVTAVPPIGFGRDRFFC